MEVSKAEGGSIDLEAQAGLLRMARAPVTRSLLGSQRIIVALDADCFYAQCEAIRRPELRGKPIGVQQKALVITSNCERLPPPPARRPPPHPASFSHALPCGLILPCNSLSPWQTRRDNSE